MVALLGSVGNEFGNIRSRPAIHDMEFVVFDLLAANWDHFVGHYLARSDSDLDQRWRYLAWYQIFTG